MLLKRDVSQHNSVKSLGSYTTSQNGRPSIHHSGNKVYSSSFDSNKIASWNIKDLANSDPKKYKIVDLETCKKIHKFVEDEERDWHLNCPNTGGGGVGKNKSAYGHFGIQSPKIRFDGDQFDISWTGIDENDFSKYRGNPDYKYALDTIDKINNFIFNKQKEYEKLGYKVVIHNF